jgi:hypothetical protein
MKKSQLNRIFSSHFGRDGNHGIEIKWIKTNMLLSSLYVLKRNEKCRRQRTKKTKENVEDIKGSTIEN